jgi:hypothetical protein
MPMQSKPGEGIRASAGSWAGIDDAEYEGWLAELYRSREDEPRNLP